MIKYQISLVNVWWDNTTIDNRYFTSLQNQTEYFENLAGGEYSPLANFEMRDNISTRITYRDESSKTPEELVASNYAIVRRVEWNEETKEVDKILNYRYFYAKVYQDSGRQVIAELELDDIQTNYFKYKNSIQNCLINRAHIDRWQESPDIDGQPAVIFNNTIDSLLFKKEPMEDLPQITFNGLKVKPKWSGNTLIDNWLEKYVKCWVYIYVKNDGQGFDKHQYTCKDLESQSNADSYLRMINVQINDKDNEYINMSSYGVLVYPIYKEGTTKFIRIKNGAGDTYRLHYFDYENNYVTGNTFTELNTDTSYVISKKLSIVCPFTDFTNASVVNDELIFERGVYTTNLFYDYGGCRVTRFSKYEANNYEWNNNCSICFCVNKSKYEMELTETGFTSKFKISDIVGSQHSEVLNPKTQSLTCMKLTLHGNADEGFEYDMLQLGEYFNKIDYSETLQPEITRYFARFNLEYQSDIGYQCVIPEKQNEDFIGDLGTIDASLPLVNSKYAEFISNNKNFWLQQNNNMITGIIQNSIGDLINGKIGSVANRPFDIFRTMNDLYCNTNSMKNAPGSLKNANSNIMFSKQIQDLSMHVTITRALQKDIQTFDDYINKFGFAVGIVDNISNYDNIRHYFNYIEAQVETITAPISNTEKQRLKERLKAIRFWNIDTIDYSMENYERRLNNE